MLNRASCMDVTPGVGGCWGPAEPEDGELSPGRAFPTVHGISSVSLASGPSPSGPCPPHRQLLACCGPFCLLLDSPALSSTQSGPHLASFYPTSSSTLPPCHPLPISSLSFRAQLIVPFLGEAFSNPQQGTETH